MAANTGLRFQDLLLMQGVLDVWFHIIHFLLAIFAPLERSSADITYDV
jgi:hypothetical protein